MNCCFLQKFQSFAKSSNRTVVWYFFNGYEFLKYGSQKHSFFDKSHGLWYDNLINFYEFLLIWTYLYVSVNYFFRLPRKFDFFKSYGAIRTSIRQFHSFIYHFLKYERTYETPITYKFGAAICSSCRICLQHHTTYESL